MTSFKSRGIKMGPEKQKGDFLKTSFEYFD
jgi:hypothetical protein